MTVAGKGGRPRKPSTVAKLENYRKDRINDAEPIPPETPVSPPSWLADMAQGGPSGRESALDVWNRLAPDLVSRKVLTAWDVDQFAMYCDAVVRHREAALDVARDGLTVEGQRGNEVKNPACQLVRDYADLAVKIGSRFGLSPADRAALSVKGEEDEGKGAERLLG